MQKVISRGESARKLGEEGCEKGALKQQIRCDSNLQSKKEVLVIISGNQGRTKDSFK